MQGIVGFFMPGKGSSTIQEIAMFQSRRWKKAQVGGSTILQKIKKLSPYLKTV